jgi:hypothetical protein
MASDDLLCPTRSIRWITQANHGLLSIRLRMLSGPATYGSGGVARVKHGPAYFTVPAVPLHHSNFLVVFLLVNPRMGTNRSFTNLGRGRTEGAKLRDGKGSAKGAIQFGAN